MTHIVPSITSQSLQLLLLRVEAEVSEVLVALVHHHSVQVLIALCHHVRVHGVPGADLWPLLAFLLFALCPWSAANRRSVFRSHDQYSLPEGRLRLASLQQRPVNTREELMTLDILAMESLCRILLQKGSNEALRRRGGKV